MNYHTEMLALAARWDVRRARLISELGIAAYDTAAKELRDLAQNLLDDEINRDAASGEPDKLADPPFTCPKCGSHHFGRDTGKVNGVIDVLSTVRCHGNSSGPGKMCDWHGIWPLGDDQNPSVRFPPPERP